MSILIDNTIKGETANSYCDTAYADDYFSSLPKADTNPKSIYWASLSDSEKQNLLIQACYDIERLKFTEYCNLSDVHLMYDNVNHVNYWAVPGVVGIAIKLNPFQQLQFPRNKDIRTDGTPFIPERVMMAQCEQAYYLGNGIDEDLLNNGQMGIRRDSFKGAGIDTRQYLDPNGSTLCAKARLWVRPFLLARTQRFERA